MSKKNQHQGPMNEAGMVEEIGQQPDENSLPEFEEEMPGARLGREIKIGLAVIAALMVLLGYVVYSRFLRPGGQATAAAQKGQTTSAPAGSAASQTAQTTSASSNKLPAPPSFASAATAPATNPFGSSSLAGPSDWTLSPGGAKTASSSASAAVGDRYASSAAGAAPKAAPPTPAPPADRYAGFPGNSSGFGAMSLSPPTSAGSAAATDKKTTDPFPKPATVASASTPPPSMTPSVASTPFSPPAIAAPSATAGASATSTVGASQPSAASRSIPSQMSTQASGLGSSLPAFSASSSIPSLPAPPASSSVGSLASAGPNYSGLAASSPAFAANSPYSSDAAPASRYNAAPGQEIAPRDRYSSMATASAAPSTGRAASTYTIQPNDNYWIISERVYGSGAYFQALAEHNRSRIPDANHLRVGDQIETPEIAALEESYPSLCPESSHRQSSQLRATAVNAPGRGAGRQYVVQEGDNLFNIARYELGKASRWSEIYELNRDALGKDIDYLTPGMTLALPGDPSPAGTLTQRAPTGTYQR